MGFDLFLLQVLNVRCANAFFDQVIPLFSDLSFWRLPLLLLGALIVLKEGRRGLLILLGVSLSLLMSDGLSSSVLKPLFDRPRPCHHYDWVRLLSTFCPRSPSFTSSHAANIFASAFFLSFFFPRLRYPFLAVALLVGFSRIYIGVHYPSDVLGGALLGIGCACLVFILLRRSVKRLGLQRYFGEV